MVAVTESEITDEQVDLASTDAETESSAVKPTNNTHPRKSSAKRKPCRCIEKRRRKVLKEITYIPMNPVVKPIGDHKAFTCNCERMRIVNRRQQSPPLLYRPTTIGFYGPRPNMRQSWG